jgi:photosystem II stability/assembly factor-like uncharacterized protein
MKTSKKLLLLFIFLLINYTLIIDNSPAQWIAQNSGTNQNLYDVEFINENTGWALGDAGVIIKTTDGGNSWFNVPNPSSLFAPNLWSVIPIDSNIIYVTSNNDFIMKTINGGIDWEIINYCPQCNSAMIAAQMINQNTGWFLGSYKLLRTFNGGQTFDSIPTPVFSPTDFYFKDINTGLICTDESRVYKTINGGLNWFDTNVPTGGVISFFRKLAVAENQYAWVAGTDAIFYRTTDFGDSWNRIDTIPNTGIVGIDFINADTGFAGGGSNKLFKSTDGGYNWAREQTDPGTVAFIASIKFIDNKTGWYVGGAGKIFHTTTGGQTMVSISGNNEFIPSEFMLYQNYPNPFNPVTNIGFRIPHSGIVSLKVFDITGREIATLVNDNLQAGEYNFQFSIDNYQLGSGIYFYTLSHGENRLSKKFILIK